MIGIAQTSDRRERGSILVQVAVALVALLGLAAFVVDYGVMWTARGQAQNSADAGALAGALALAFDNPDDEDGARAKAIGVARANLIWAAAPDVTDADIAFPACPPGAPGLPDACVRVNVFRNQRAGGSPLPTFFARLAGVMTQGVRATATAQVLAGDSAQCVKPFAIPDKWSDDRDTPQDNAWTPDDSFERYVQNGRGAGALLVPPDVYVPPGTVDHTGFTVEIDYGTPLTLKHGNPQQAIQPGWFFPIVINPVEGPGGSTYRQNIATCDPTVIGPGTILQTEPGNMVGPTSQGIEDLIAQDPYPARWDPAAADGRGAPVGGCMEAGTCGVSPRLVAVAIFDPDVFDEGRAGGRTDITVTKIMGFWIEGMQGNDVLGYLTHYPALALGNAPIDEDTTFLRTVILVR